MIDFKSITKTLDGKYDMHYCGSRTGGDGTLLHCFALWCPKDGVYEQSYDASGEHLICPDGRWCRAESDAFRIVPKKRKVTVTHWLCIQRSTLDDTVFRCFAWGAEPTRRQKIENGFIHIEKITREIEVAE